MKRSCIPRLKCYLIDHKEIIEAICSEAALISFLKKHTSPDHLRCYKLERYDETTYIVEFLFLRGMWFYAVEPI